MPMSASRLCLYLALYERSREGSFVQPLNFPMLTLLLFATGVSHPGGAFSFFDGLRDAPERLAFRK
jgi:hypothetical protein